MTYTYQWLRYDGDIVGETSSTISFSPLREADVGRYNCRVSDGSMTTTCDGVVINVESKCNWGYNIIYNIYIRMTIIIIINIVLDLSVFITSSGNHIEGQIIL